MCRRFSLTAGLSELYEQFDIDRVLTAYSGRSSHVPRETVHVVVSDGEIKSLDGYTWGIFPFWAKDSINAASETVHEHPSFRHNFLKTRCVIPCDGFYGWAPLGRKKRRPVRFALRDRSVFALAGIYDVWTNPRGGEFRTCSIMTTRPNRVVSEFDDRMPVILEGQALATWLNPAVKDADVLASCLRPCHPDRMTVRLEAEKFLLKD